MALDKNYIDTTDFSIFQPAIDYYERHGSPEQRLKTRYYQGRIYMNRGDDDKALTALLRAAEDSATCTDISALARLYRAQGVLYYRQDAIRSVIESNYKALRYYSAAGDSLGTYLMQTNLLECATLLNDSILAKKMMSNVSRISMTGFDDERTPLATIIVAHYAFDSETELQEALPTLEKTIYADSIHNPFLLMNLAMCYDKLGEYSKALSLIQSVEIKEEGNYTLAEIIKFNAIAGEIYAHCNLPQQSLTEYLNYIKNTTQQYDYMLNSGVLYTKDRYMKDMEQIKNNAVHYQQVLIGFIIFLLIVLFLIAAHVLTKQLKNQSNFWTGIRKQRTLVTMNLLITKQDLESVQRRIMEENNRLNESNERLTSKTIYLEKNILALENDLSVEKEKSNQFAETVSAFENSYTRDENYDSFLRGLFSQNNKKGYNIRQIEQDSRENKDKFLDHVVTTFLHSHPDMITYFKKCNLTTNEIRYCCCIMLGVGNKQIEEYVGIRRVWDFASEVRNKLNIPPKGKNLRTHLSQM